ncbi:hypothetical protein [Hephaestia mangrovi]|uniref:hypothetical protein n=1 Tax=Hephaestia mangrovi TaxID=2873268 RepID=UPI001CA7256B|nr:hypothetical protein [Hephaestia mangrovi]MBY8827108.1 hypothetical protein [Hephaestia mangrovi]
MVEEERVVETPEGRPAETHTTVIERRGGGGGAVLIGIAVLVLAIIGAFYFYNKSQNDNVRTDAITSAAQSVSDGAQKVGDAAQQAADDSTNQ